MKSQQHSIEELTKQVPIFQIMYSGTVEELQPAIAGLALQPHNAHVPRVQAFLDKEKEWVLLYHSHLTARGHNTNNFTETSICALKNNVLCRTKTFNATALMYFVTEVWEQYFQRRLLRHAHNCVAANNLLYDNLLSRMPKEAANGIISVGDHLYSVPSADGDGKVYEVCNDIGMCTCRSGNSGAFCKHQAIMQKSLEGRSPMLLHWQQRTATS